MGISGCASMSKVPLKTLTPEQVEEAKRLRATPTRYHPVMSTRKIANTMKVSEYAVCRALGLLVAPDYRADPLGKDFGLGKVSIAIPEEVLLERERVMGADVPLSVALLGDPRPGRSALDRKRNEQSRTETQNWEAGKEWADLARAWHRPERSGGPIAAQDGGRLLARLAQGHSYREAT